LFKAVCIGQRFVHKEIVPGKVRLVVIPYVHELQGINKNTPRLALNDLEEIKEYVAQYTSPMAEVEVINPLYEIIQVRCKIEFQGGAGASFNIRTLSQALTDYLSPWLNNPDANIQTGGSVSMADMINFIESQNYVKGIRKFSLLRTYKDSDEYFIDEYRWPEASEIQAFAPWSVFASADTHIIMQADDDSFPDSAGIDNLGIGSNFIISEPELLDGSEDQPQEEETSSRKYVFTLNFDKINSL
jgi:hypothetical protein